VNISLTVVIKKYNEGYYVPLLASVFKEKSLSRLFRCSLNVKVACLFESILCTVCRK